MSALSDPAFWIQNVLLIAAFIPLYRDWMKDRKEAKRIDVELEKGYEASVLPINSLYHVTIQHPSKTLEHCKVFLDTIQLRFTDSRITPLLDRKIPQMSGANVWIPEENRRDDAWVIVMNGDEEIKRQKFGDVPYTPSQLPPRT